MTPPPPGAGSYSLTLATPSFYLLAAILGLFIVMLWYLWATHAGRRRGLEGYLDAVGVDLGFLLFGVALVIGLVAYDPNGNVTSWALYRTILSGYWFAFAIPIVTVGSSVESRSRRTIRWFYPSIVIAALLFLGIFAIYLVGG